MAAGAETSSERRSGAQRAAEPLALPEVSVVIPVHNGARFVDATLKSIRAQTLGAIEIVVVDDASTDETPSILAAHAAEDRRVRIETLAENHRIPRALNRGLELCRGRYIARIDADDLAKPERLAVQAAFLDAHPEVHLVGSSIDWIDEAGRFLKTSHRPRDSFAVRWLARFLLTITQSTFLFRPNMPDGAPVRYDPHFLVSEDHDLLCRIAEAGGEAVCLSAALVQYRLHGSSISKRKADETRRLAKEVALRFQASELPDEIREAIAPVNACYFDLADARSHAPGVFGGIRLMAMHDISRVPEKRVWVRRQSAQMAQFALSRGGLGPAAIAQAFALHGRDFLAPAGLRALETKRLLPGWMASDGEIG